MSVPRLRPEEHRSLARAYTELVEEGRIAHVPRLYVQSLRVFVRRRPEGEWYDATSHIVTQQRHEESWTKAYYQLKKSKNGA